LQTRLTIGSEVMGARRFDMVVIRNESKAAFDAYRVSSCGSGGRDVDQNLADRTLLDGLMCGGRIG
jgi:hypothetical protein